MNRHGDGRPLGRVLVVELAVDDAHAVGHVRLLKQVEVARLLAHLDELYVVPSVRGHGVGRALLEALIALARERGAAGAEVVTGEDDTAARALYERFGFLNETEGPANSRSLFYELDLE